MGWKNKAANSHEASEMKSKLRSEVVGTTMVERAGEEVAYLGTMLEVSGSFHMLSVMINLVQAWVRLVFLWARVTVSGTWLNAPAATPFIINTLFFIAPSPASLIILYIQPTPGTDGWAWTGWPAAFTWGLTNHQFRLLTTPSFFVISCYLMVTQRNKRAFSASRNCYCWVDEIGYREKKILHKRSPSQEFKMQLNTKGSNWSSNLYTGVHLGWPSFPSRRLRTYQQILLYDVSFAGPDSDFLFSTIYIFSRQIDGPKSWRRRTIHWFITWWTSTSTINITIIFCSLLQRQQE